MMEVILIVLAILGVIGLGYLVRGLVIIYRAGKSFGKPRKFGTELHKLGVKAIWAEREGASPIIEALLGSQNRAAKLQKVQMMGQSLAWLKNQGDQALKELFNTGCRFEFLLLDPNSELMDMRCKQENPDLKNECLGFIKWIQEEFSMYESQLEVRVYRMTPTMGMTILNEKTLYVSHYAMTRRTHDMPMLMMERGGMLFDRYSNEFKDVWSVAKKVFSIAEEKHVIGAS